MTKLEAQIRILKPFPTSIFGPARAEALQIDWRNLPVPDTRSKTSVFSTSVSNHLRVHKKAPNAPDTREANGRIIECIDTKARSLFPRIDDLVLWMHETLESTHLGRIMVVKLAAESTVGSHIDAGKYFEFHFRFHVPLVTFPEVSFTGPEGSKPLHMPEGYLCQLLNQNLHGVKNDSNFDRIHLIVDLASSLPSLEYPRIRYEP